MCVPNLVLVSQNEQYVSYAAPLVVEKEHEKAWTWYTRWAIIDAEEGYLIGLLLRYAAIVL